MQEVSRYIVHNYQNKITLDEVAKHFGMNRTSFCAFFKREKGKSFFTTLNEYRIECSCLMLRETTLPIANICSAVGFDDIPYYNRTFKKLKGISPKDYRFTKNEIT
jgi:AraC-type DNA-binding domain-containing proteins